MGAREKIFEDQRASADVLSKEFMEAGLNKKDIPFQCIGEKYGFRIIDFGDTALAMNISNGPAGWNPIGANNAKNVNSAIQVLINMMVKHKDQFEKDKIVVTIDKNKIANKIKQAVEKKAKVKIFESRQKGK
jgi:hypothetical protein